MAIGVYSPLTARIPQTPGGTKHTHAVMIRVNGQTVGRIASFAPRQNRGVTKIFELNSRSTGRAVDQVPGVVETDEIEVQGMEVWTKPFEEAIGASGDPMTHLADQTDPFEIHEVWTYPDGHIETVVYYGCLLGQSNPEPLQGDGNKVYRKNATIHVLGRTRV